MNAIVLEQPGRFVQATMAEPATAPRGSAVVRVRRVGICGTDWGAYHGRQPFFSYPRILGHELGVEIESVNDPASALRPGERCCVEPYLNCGACIACRRGKTNCCINLKVLGVHCDGGMCERLIVPTRKLHRAEKLSLDQLALVETLAIGRHAVARADVEAGENGLILGAGPIGLSIVPFVRAAGIEPVIADVSDQRLAFARNQMGIARTIDARRDVREQLASLLGGELPTIVFDATGNAASMAGCFELVAHGGRIVFVGLCQGDIVFDDPNFHRREVTLLASRNALPGDFRTIIRMIEEGKVDTTPWITHRTPAAALPDVLPAWLSPEANVLKAMIEF